MKIGVVLYTVISHRLVGFDKTLREAYNFGCTQTQGELYGAPVFRFEFPDLIAGFIPGGAVEVYRPGEASSVPFRPKEVIAITELNHSCLEINFHYCLECGGFVNGLTGSEAGEIRCGGTIYGSIDQYKCRCCGHDWKVAGR